MEGESNNGSAVAEAPPVDEQQKVGSETTTDLAELVPDADHWKAILKARKREQEAQWRVSGLAEQLKQAKKDHEAASDYLGRLIDEANNPTLFTGVKPAADGDAAPVEAWRDVALEEVGIDGKAIEKLLAAGIDSLGKLADYTKADKPLTDIDGIGAKTAEKIEESLLAYWAAHPIEQPVGALEWVNDGGGVIYAANTAGIEVEADVACEFEVAPDGDKFDVGGSDSRLMPDESPGEFATLDAAKAWCEARNAELAKNREPEAAAV